MTERRIREIEDRIRRAVIIDPTKATSVQVGTTVKRVKICTRCLKSGKVTKPRL